MNCNLCMSQFLQTVCETTHRSVSSVFFSILSDPTPDTPQTALHDGLKSVFHLWGKVLLTLKVQHPEPVLNLLKDNRNRASQCFGDA